MIDMTIIIRKQLEESNIKRCVMSFNGLDRSIVMTDSEIMDMTIEKNNGQGANINMHTWNHYAERRLTP